MLADNNQKSKSNKMPLWSDLYPGIIFVPEEYTKDSNAVKKI